MILALADASIEGEKRLAAEIQDGTIDNDDGEMEVLLTTSMVIIESIGMHTVMESELHFRTCIHVLYVLKCHSHAVSVWYNLVLEWYSINQ